MNESMRFFEEKNSYIVSLDFSFTILNSTEELVQMNIIEIKTLHSRGTGFLDDTNY